MLIARLFLDKFYFSALVMLFFVLWIEFSPITFSSYGAEDYVIENLTAIFFLISSIGFFITALKSTYLKKQNTNMAYFMIIAWAILMFIFFGEEISWGQRIFNFNTPDSLMEVNLQGEFNIHNIGIVDTALGGKYRYLSIMMLLTGVIFPLTALTSWGKKIFQKFNYPICPLQFMLFFLGSYIFGKFYSTFPEGLPDPNSASEAREFLFGLGMACFALYGIRKPNSLFLEKD